MLAEQPIGIFEALPNALYHSGPGLSSSDLKELLKTPAHYQASKDPSNRKETDAMDFGTAFHTAILEPHLFASTVALEPPEITAMGSKAKNPCKAHWDQFKAANAGKSIFNADDSKRLSGMIASVKRHKLAMSIVSHSKKELTAYALHHGVLQKARADMIIPQRSVIADLKTTVDASPAGFAKAVTKYGYHISAAYYLQTFTLALGHEIKDFLWIAVENTAPYGVAIYAASAEQLAIGKGRAAMAVDAYKQCIASGNWPCYSEDIKELEIHSRWL